MHVTLVSGIDPGATRPGGTRSYVLGLAERLRRHRVDVSLVARDGQPADLDRVDYFRIPSGPSSARFLLRLAATTPGLEIPRDSIIHVQRPDDLLPFAIAKRKNPKVCTLHGTPAVAILRRRGPAYATAYRTLERLGLRYAHRVIAVDEKTRDWYARRYPWVGSRTTVIPVAVDTDRFHPMDRDAARARFEVTHRYALLYAGRLAVEKRVESIIQAMRGIPDAELLIAGEGPRAKALHELAEGAPVRFLNTVPHEDMPNLMNAVDLLVLPSEFEGVPTAILEALACGTAVVATPVGAVPDFVLPGKTGWLVGSDLRNLEQVVEGGLPLARDLKRDCVSVAQRYSWDAVLDRILAVYRDAEAAR